MNDLELLNKIRKKDQQAFQILFETYKRYIIAIISKIGGNRISNQDIEEICSDVFINIWNKAYKINLHNNNLKSYIAVIARNQTLNYIRKNKKDLEIELENDTIVCTSAEETYMNKEQAQIIKQLLDELEEPDKRFFIQRYFYMEKIVDIAKNSDMNVKTVGSKLMRAKQKLQAIFKERGF